MKLFLMSLLVAGVSQWATASVACPEHDGDVVKHKIVRIIGDDVKGDGKIVVECQAGDKGKVLQFISEDGNTHANFIVTDGSKAESVFVLAAGPNDGRSDKRRFIVRRIGDEAKGGWLGVSIADVPDALASQLDIEGKGVIIQNVVEGSPADKAGLEVYDILLLIDDSKVDGDINRAIRLVKANKPGDEIEVIVLRDGEERELLVELGSRADLKGAHVDWKFEFAPDAEIEDRIQAFGKMMWRSEDGSWEVKNLGDLHDLKNLPDAIKMFIPKSGERTVQIFNEGGTHKIRMKVQRDGNVLVVERDGDAITVTRVEDGEETENTYDGMDELRDEDEEVYDMLHNAMGPIGVRIDLQGIADIDLEDIEGLHDLHNLHIEIPDFEFEFDSEEFEGHMNDWHEQLEQSLEAAKGAHADAMKEFHILMGHSVHGDKSGNIKKGSPHFLWKSDKGDSFKNLKNFQFFGKPKHSFKVQTDGTIEVRIRKGDSEMVQLFEDETDLRRRNPDLFDKYEELMSIEDED